MVDQVAPGATPDGLDDLQVVVVHHDHYPEVLDTVRDLQAAGVSPDAIVVVDNSEDEALFEALAADLEGLARLSLTHNDGYAAAVNAGVLTLHDVGRPLTLVCTHEARVSPPAVRRLVEVARVPGVGAVGPLLRRIDGEELWSSGGRLTRVLLRPVHRRRPSTRGTERVDWVDGAFVVYPTGVLETHPLREEFFLYYEETELQTRLRREGLSVLVATDAVARQDTGGMPPYYRFRGAVIFQHLHGTPWSRLASVPTQLAVHGLRSLLLGRPRQLTAAMRGVRDGRRVARTLTPYALPDAPGAG